MKIDIAHIAKLANLPLTPEEEKKYEAQLSQILEYINKLNEVDTENIEPTFNVTGLKNALREDKVCQSLSQENALQNASSKKNGLFETQGIFKED